jgi:hypothetical protein
MMRTGKIGNRFKLNENGCVWDLVAAFCVGRAETQPRHNIAITGLVSGDDGALLVRLPGVIETYWALEPG